jgi:hypothetical protein
MAAEAGWATVQHCCCSVTEARHRMLLTCPRASARLTAQSCCASVRCIAAKQLMRYMRRAAGARPSPSPGLHPHKLLASYHVGEARAACLVHAGEARAVCLVTVSVHLTTQKAVHGNSWSQAGHRGDLEGPLGRSSAALRSHMSTSGSRAAASTDSNSAAAAAAVLSPLRYALSNAVTTSSSCCMPSATC